MVLSLILEEIDEDTKCISNFASFDAQNVVELGSLLEIDFGDDTDIDYQYDLTQLQAAVLASFYNISGLSGKGTARIRSRAPFDDVPYEIHTGRELSLMLSGDKPMAYFIYHEGCEFRDPIEEAFERYMSSQNIIRNEYALIVDEEEQRKARYIVFTLPGQEWRANALMLLIKTSLKSGWSEGMERMEGTLLGYEDWQNDLYIEYSRTLNLK